MTALGPGVLVRCVVDAKVWLTTNHEAVPVKGVVYTVRTVEVDHDGAYIRLVEIVNPIDAYAEGLREAQFNAAGFTPVDDTIFQIDQYTDTDLPNEVEAV